MQSMRAAPVVKFHSYFVVVEIVMRAIELSACGMNIPLRNFDWRPEAAIRPAKSRSGAVAHTLMLLLMVQSTCHMEISLAWDLPRGHANHFGLVLCVYISKLEELEVPSLILVHI